MAWPTDTVTAPHTGEMYIDGAWVNVSSRIRTSTDQVRIQRGRNDIQGSALLPPTTCDLTLNNADGTFTDDNPLSPYFEKLPLFTPFRFSMANGSDHYMYLPGHDTINYARTTDKALVDITGDIDVRIDIAPTSWNPSSSSGSAGTDTMVLASKSGDPNNQMSWFFALRQDGKLYWNSTPTGNGFTGIGFVSAVLPTPTERMAVRATLDVDNGAGSFTLTFYYSDTIDGSWTTLTTINGASFGLGTTSLFNSTGLVEVGAGWLGGSVYSNSKTYSGKIYAFQLRNGINGTLVANANFRTQPYGNANFSDGLGNTWEVRNGAVIAGDDLRFWGEIETLPQEWDSTGRDTFSRVHAQDITGRLGTNAQPVTSPIYQNRIAADPTGYWTFEDGADSTQAAAASRNTVAAIASNIRFQAADDLPGSNGVAQFAGATAFARGRARSSSVTGTASVLIYFKMGTAPASTVPIISVMCSGSSLAWWRLETDGASINTKAIDSDGTVLVSSPFLLGPVSVTEWVAIRLELTTSGGNINWATAWHQVGSDLFYGGSGSLAGTVGRFTGFTVWGTTANTDMYFAHAWLDSSKVDFVTAEFQQSSNGFIGEKFGARFRRICGAIGVTADVDGWDFDTSTVGRQPIDTPLKILQDGADVDGGILMASRRAGNTLTYVTRKRIQTEQKTVTLSHSSSHLAAPPKPVKDSVGVRNDVTVFRKGGSSTRVTVSDGRYGTAAIGTVPAQYTYNTETDEQTSDIAGFLAAIGAAGEYRFPEIVTALHRPQTLFGSTLAKSILAVDAGRFVEISNLPAGQAPGPYEQLVSGYSEVIVNKTWTITFNGIPYTVWRAGIIENGTEPIRFAGTDTTLNADVTSGATTLVFKTPDTSARWVTSADSPPTGTFPMDVMIGGEWIRVSNITGTTAAGGFYTQTATVVRSINGIAKAQTAGTPIQLRRIARFGR